MKIFFSLLSLILFNLSFSQKEKKDFFIFYNNNQSIEQIVSQNDSIYQETYFIKHQTNCAKKIELQVNNEDELLKKITLKAGRLRITRLIYKNLNGDSPPVIVNEKKITNSIKINELINEINPDNLFAILDNFKNIYLINEDTKTSGYYIAKKITVEKDSSGL